MKGGNLMAKRYTPDEDVRILASQTHRDFRELAEELSAIPGKPKRSADSLYQRKRSLLGLKNGKNKKKETVSKAAKTTIVKAEENPVQVSSRASMQQIKFPGGTIVLQSTPRMIEVIEDSQGRVEGIRWTH